MKPTRSYLMNGVQQVLKLPCSDSHDVLGKLNSNIEFGHLLNQRSAMTSTSLWEGLSHSHFPPCSRLEVLRPSCREGYLGGIERLASLCGLVLL